MKFLRGAVRSTRRTAGCAFRIPVRIEMIGVFVALGQRAFDVALCPSGCPGCDSISAVVSRTVPSRGSRVWPPAPRPKAPVRRKARPFSDLRPGALVLAFHGFGRDGVKDSSFVRLETVVRWHRQGFHLYWRWETARGRLDDRALSQRFVISSSSCIAQIPPGVLLGPMASCSSSA